MSFPKKKIKELYLWHASKHYKVCTVYKILFLLRWNPCAHSAEEPLCVVNFMFILPLKTREES